MRQRRWHTVLSMAEATHQTPARLICSFLDRVFNENPASTLCEHSSRHCDFRELDKLRTRSPLLVTSEDSMLASLESTKFDFRVLPGNCADTEVVNASLFSLFSHGTMHILTSSLNDHLRVDSG